MKCNQCHHDDTQGWSDADAADGEHRRPRAPECGSWFTTYERLERSTTDRYQKNNV